MPDGWSLIIPVPANSIRQDVGHKQVDSMDFNIRRLKLPESTVWSCVESPTLLAPTGE